MRGHRYTADGVLTRQAARRIVRPHAKLLATVINESWMTWSAMGIAQPDVRAKIGASARAFNVADFIKHEAAWRFKEVGGCTLTMPYSRPVLTLGGGDLLLKFGKISLEPGIKPRTARQLEIFNQDAAASSRLPDTPSATWAKCGYLLDPTETTLVSVTVTCEQEGVRLWQLHLPVSAPKAMRSVTPMVSSSVPPARISSAHTPASADTEAASSD